MAPLGVVVLLLSVSLLLTLHATLLLHPTRRPWLAAASVASELLLIASYLQLMIADPGMIAGAAARRQEGGPLRLRAFVAAAARGPQRGPRRSALVFSAAAQLPRPRRSGCGTGSPQFQVGLRLFFWWGPPSKQWLLTPLRKHEGKFSEGLYSSPMEQ